MAITLTETDTAGAVAGVQGPSFCSAGDQETSYSTKQATSGGTAGVTAVSLTTGAFVGYKEDIYFNSASNEPNNTSWASGTWTIRVEVTTANMNLDGWRAAVCRVNAAVDTSLGTVLADTVGVGDFATTGIKSVAASGSAQTANESDRVLVMVEPHNSTTMTQTFAYKPSQNIDTPVLLGTGLVETLGAYPPRRAWDAVNIGYNL